MEESELEEVINFINEEGLCIRLTNGTYKVFKDFPTAEGELVWLRDLNILALGEEKSTIGKTRYYVTIDSGTDYSLSPDQQIASFWKRLSNNTVEGEVVKIILPENYDSWFTSMKPSHFSFLEGGVIPEGSLFYGLGWENIPDSRGCFTRGVDTVEELGEVLEDQIGRHSHNLKYPYVNSLENSSINYTPYQKKKDKDKGNGFLFDSVGRFTSLPVAKEVRPKNIAVLRVWKIGEFAF